MIMKRIKRWVLGSINYELRIRAANCTLRVPVINNVGRAHLDEHEPHLSAIFERLHAPGTLLVDVGANIGQTLVKYAAVAGLTCRYIGFEPNPKAASYVDELIIRNEMHNAIIVAAGLGSQTGLAKLFLHAAGSTDPAASMHDEIRDSDFYGSHKIISVFNGDQVLGDLGVSEEQVILKIDVEGFELEVLRGLEKSLERLRPVIILEILPPSYFSQTVNDYRLQHAEKLKQHMSDRGYTEHAIGAEGQIVSGVSPTGDYLFLPREKDDLLRCLKA